MKRIVLSLAIVAAASTASWAVFAADKKDKHSDKKEAAESTMMKMDEAPEAVQAAIKKAAGKASIEEVEKETEDGLTLYGAGWKKNGVDHEVVVNADGQLMEKEKSVSGDGVPAAVRKAAMKNLPKGAKAEFELKTVMLYEVEAMVDGKEIEMLVDPSGRVVKLTAAEENEDDEADDDDDDDNDEDEDEDEDEDDGEHEDE